MRLYSISSICQVFRLAPKMPQNPLKSRSLQELGTIRNSDGIEYSQNSKGAGGEEEFTILPRLPASTLSWSAISSAEYIPPPG